MHQLELSGQRYAVADGPAPPHASSLCSTPSCSLPRASSPIALAKSAIAHAALVPVALEDGGGEVMKGLEKETVEGAPEETEKEVREKAAGDLW